MSCVVDMRSYAVASSSRLLVIVDLQQKNHGELSKDGAIDLSRSLDNCMAAIRHARNLGLPIAFTRQGENQGRFERSAQSAWISGFEPRRSEMVFERQQPSCYTSQLFDDVVSQIGSFVIAGLVADQTCLATAIDASHRGHRVTFLSDASASRGRIAADAGAVHAVTTNAIALFADTVTTRHWLAATSPRSSRGHRYG